MKGKCFQLARQPSAQFRVISTTKRSAKVHGPAGDISTIELVTLKANIKRGDVIEITKPTWRLLQWRY